MRFSRMARIVGLHYISEWDAAAFDFAHWCVGQTVIVILSGLFFAFWVAGGSRRNVPARIR